MVKARGLLRYAIPTPTDLLEGFTEPLGIFNDTSRRSVPSSLEEIVGSQRGIAPLAPVVIGELAEDVLLIESVVHLHGRSFDDTRDDEGLGGTLGSVHIIIDIGKDSCLADQRYYVSPSAVGLSHRNLEGKLLPRHDHVASGAREELQESQASETEGRPLASRTSDDTVGAKVIDEDVSSGSRFAGVDCNRGSSSRRLDGEGLVVPNVK
jgi:hypothetical protein